MIDDARMGNPTKPSAAMVLKMYVTQINDLEECIASSIKTLITKMTENHCILKSQ